MAVSRPPLQAFLLAVAAGTSGGCSIDIEKPVDNDVIALPSKTNVVVTGNAAYSHLKLTVDGVDFSNQMVSTPGANRSEGNLSLAAGLHTINASAEVPCWYCSGGKTQSTDTKSFVVTSGTHVCSRSGGAPVITLDASVIAVGQQPGLKQIGYKTLNGSDFLVILVEDAPGSLQPKCGWR